MPAAGRTSATTSKSTIVRPRHDAMPPRIAAGSEARLNTVLTPLAARQVDDEAGTGRATVGNDVTVDAAREPPREREPSPFAVTRLWRTSADAGLEDTVGLVVGDTWQSSSTV